MCVASSHHRKSSEEGKTHLQYFLSIGHRIDHYFHYYLALQSTAKATMPLFQRRNDETAACRGVEIRKKVSNRGFALEETRGSSFLRLQEESSTQEFKPNNKELAIQRVNFLFSESALLKSSAGWKFPTFSRKELVLRRTLGRGSFSIVEEIRAMVFCPSTAYRRSDSVAENDKESRQFIAQHCIRSSGDARYAIKSLRQDVLGDPDRCWAGITDLIVEAHFLRHLEHPHIIKLRGVARCDPYSKNYFLILDRLYCTLSTRLREWKAKQGRLHSPLGFLFDPLRKASKSLLHERLIAAYHLSSAFAYLHSNNILHRDCKPENVGFDIVSSISVVALTNSAVGCVCARYLTMSALVLKQRDDIKLFDFGLAREVTAKDSNGDGTYKLSHMTGSLRYMAPEGKSIGLTLSLIYS